MHTFKKVPRFPRSLVGSTLDDWKVKAEQYCAAYPSQLDLAKCDCKTFSLQLSRALTDVEIGSLDELSTATPSLQGDSDEKPAPDLLDWR